MSLQPQADGTFLDDETGLVYDSNGQIVQPVSTASVTQTADNVQQAAIRAHGIDPATLQWIAPQYNTGGDPAVLAQQYAKDAQSFYDAQYAANKARLDALNQKAGGFLADILNPFSANIDPNAWNAKLANSLKSVNWTAVIALGIVLAVLATVHEVREVV